jgi:hypothetical protein
MSTAPLWGNLVGQLLEGFWEIPMSSSSVFSLTQLVLRKESFGIKCLLSGDSGGSDYVTEPNLRYFIKLSPHSSWLSNVQTHPMNYIFLTQVRSYYKGRQCRCWFISKRQPEQIRWHSCSVLMQVRFNLSCF